MSKITFAPMKGSQLEMAVRRWAVPAIKYHRNVEVKRLGRVEITAEYEIAESRE